MTSHSKNEERLTGGNVSNVYRSGDTVRRDSKPGSAKIHKLLKHIENKGFSKAPRFLGIDEKGREILTFIEGEVGNYPLKKYMWSNEVLVEIAKMLRQYHDTVSDFTLEDEWKPIDHTPGIAEVICHNDFAIYNMIFNNEKLVGIIDFDMAAPGPRLWDIAYTLYTCIPLSRLYHSESGEAVYYHSAKDADRIKQRVQLFFESYGMEELKEGCIDMVLLRLEGLRQTMIRKALEGDSAFQQMIDRGELDHYQKDIQFIRENGEAWI